MTLLNAYFEVPRKTSKNTLKFWAFIHKNIVHFKQIYCLEFLSLILRSERTDFVIVRSWEYESLLRTKITFLHQDFQDSRLWILCFYNFFSDSLVVVLKFVIIQTIEYFIAEFIGIVKENRSKLRHPTLTHTRLHRKKLLVGVTRSLLRSPNAKYVLQ
jgi:hypothetical protein